MEFSPVLSGQAGIETAVNGGCGAAVCVDRVDVAGLSDVGLRALRDEAGTSGSDFCDGLSLAWFSSGGKQDSEPVVV